MPRFTIGIPTYNRADLLRQSLASAVGQSSPDVEVLVSDNASTDETPQVVRSFGDRVRYHRNPSNIGSWPNFARLVELAGGEFFSWLQDDDLLHRDFARRAADALALSEDTDAYVAYSYLSPSITTFYYPTMMGPVVPLDWMQGGLRILEGSLVTPLSLLYSFGMPPALAFRTSALRDALRTINPDCELFNERIVLSAATARGKIAVDPWPAALFRRHADQAHQVILRGAPDARQKQWSILANTLGHSLESRDDRWQEALSSFLPEIPVEYRLKWLNEDTPGPNVWQSVHPLAAQVREMLVASIPPEARGRIRGPSRESRAKQVVRGLVPPVLWKLLRGLLRPGEAGSWERE